MNNDLYYRADIDGLRAISIIAVLVYHIAPSRAPNGYLGVDVFFVISGFLITGIIIRDLQRGDFSLTDFFRRRIARLFPALLTVLTTTIPLAWMVLTPQEFYDFLDQLVAGTLYVSNFFYYLQSGYFRSDALKQPFLHLWSLSVEEQFYLIMPVLLMAAWRFVALSGVGRVLLLVATASLLSMLSLQGSSAAFFITWFRVWEFIAGGLLAWVLLRYNPPPMPQAWADLISAVGLLLIIAPMLMRYTLPHPGWITFAPVIGTLFVLYTRTGLIVRHLLGNRLAVFIGLISYPLYVWHYPLLSLAEYAFVQGLNTRTGKLFFITVVIALASLTWWLLERPARRNPRRVAVPLLAAASALALTAFTARTAQVSTRVTDEFLAIAASAMHDWRYFGELKPMPSEPPCVYINRLDRLVQVVVVGDSHAQQYAPRVAALTRTQPSRVRGISFVTETGCPPVEGLFFENNTNCHQHLVHVFDHLQRHRHSITDVVLAGAWNRYFFDFEFIDRYGVRINCGQETISPHHPLYRQCFINGLKTIMQRIRAILPNARLVLLLDNPLDERMSPNYHLKRRNYTPMLLSYRLASALGINGTTNGAGTWPDIRPFLQKEEQIRLSIHLRESLVTSADTILDPAPHICPQYLCNPLFRYDGHTWFKYRDNDHLTSTYARRFDFIDQLLINARLRSQ